MTINFNPPNTAPANTSSASAGERQLSAFSATENTWCPLPAKDLWNNLTFKAVAESSIMNKIISRFKDGNPVSRAHKNHVLQNNFDFNICMMMAMEGDYTQCTSLLNSFNETYSTNDLAKGAAFAGKVALLEKFLPTSLQDFRLQDILFWAIVGGQVDLANQLLAKFRDVYRVHPFDEIVKGLVAGNHTKALETFISDHPDIKNAAKLIVETAAAFGHRAIVMKYLPQVQAEYDVLNRSAVEAYARGFNVLGAEILAKVPEAKKAYGRLHGRLYKAPINSHLAGHFMDLANKQYSAAKGLAATNAGTTASTADHRNAQAVVTSSAPQGATTEKKNPALISAYLLAAVESEIKSLIIDAPDDGKAERATLTAPQIRKKRS